MVFTYAPQQTAVVSVMSVIGHANSASQAWAAWLLSSSLMVATVATASFGRLVDLHGGSQMLRIALGAILAGSRERSCFHRWVR